MKLLAYDVGGTEIKYALIEDALNLSDQGYVPTPVDTFDHFVEVIRQIYEPYRNEADGIAMCLPGPVDVENGLCEKCSIMKYPHSSEVARILGEACGTKVVLENDAKAAVLAEYRYGSLKGCRNAAAFVIGTGVGGGLIVDHEIVRGKRFTAGEFSFLSTDAAHYEDPDKMLGSLCSTSFLLRRYQELSHSEVIDGREFFRRYPDDVNAQIALDELCRNIAVQIYNLYWLLDLEKVAIGGGISRQPVLIEKIREKFNEVQSKAFTARFGTSLPLEIVPCRFSNDANLIGAYITFETLSR